eukprot:3687558-Alexandrium_andersonii.AAC.1
MPRHQAQGCVQETHRSPLARGNDPRIAAAGERFYGRVVAAGGDPALPAPAAEGQAGQSASAGSAGAREDGAGAA